MKNYRYTLEPYKGPSSRYTCPACGVKHQLVRYIDTETNRHLADHIGRCNREYQCGYHAKPKEYLEEVNRVNSNMGNTRYQIPNSNMVNPRYQIPNPNMGNSRYQIANPNMGNSKYQIPNASGGNPKYQIAKPTPPDYMPEHVLNETLCCYADNHFVRFLEKKLGAAATQDLINRYKIGTNHYWDSSTVFWQIDVQGRIRTGKVMLYNPATGKRLKEHGQSFITWMHKVMRYDDYTLRQCLFGEHLLNTSQLPVAIAESEKTAIIAAHYIPHFVWLAAGSLKGLTAEKLKVCRGRRIMLFPDAGAYNEWSAIAATVPNCKVSPMVEDWCRDKNEEPGSDIADMLLKMAG